MTKKVSIETFLKMDFSHIIDVRSPREYAESHIPNAINCAVLNNDEFECIGALYKQNSFKARVLGASFVSANISKHLLNLQDKISPKKPIGIHCARGGMRSQAFFTVLSAIGYQVALLEGGYKTYRKEVVRYLQSPLPHRFVTLVGKTGSGKSEIIASFENSLDLEKIAKHLGSSFGAIYGFQPSVKDFQNMLFARLKKLESVPFVLIEGESKKIGNLILPSILYNSYQSSPKILIQTPLQARIQRITEQYGKISPAFFENAMQKIAPFMKKEYWQSAKDAFWRGDLERVAEILLVEYYDRVYKKESYVYSIPYHSLEQTQAEICDFATQYYV
ncbi:tRNA 2-selenouridine(34) synthase MnmH [Helicobacter turcicus]|uniref:tRNA 2-selenouridine(34) synthase MnmH n=1 Tax=Helicobacter turcicus TaxID=2867412 RepID=A0ABS7JL25_9HELI|nr:tRNA 2-selenouridine(34) synthase MnmH [Helicobacter turcicus]MBX7490100.1 tRNA 2-selenouridine(34) synthase MnmH [Helicobacter turcicus]MBX7544959.1 tRNA 2-selenouridine(34) synthase MnmH [Helicobacter turcicus]